MATFFIVIAFGFVALVDLVPLIKRRSKGAVVTFCVIFALAFVMAVLHSQNITMPSTLRYIGQLMKSVGISYQT
jgi:protein-S-isoprenylcysteine O-methyltransferase Ste14